MSVSKNKINNVTEFFTMDLNYQSLKDYLGQVTNTINKQGQCIQELQQQIQTKVQKKEVFYFFDKLSDSFQKIVDLSNIPNPDLLKLLSGSFLKPSTQQDDYNNNVNNVANKMGLYGDSLAIIFNKFIQQEDRINQLESKLHQKTDQNWVKDKIQNSKEKLEKNFSTDIHVLKQKIDDIAQQTNKIISDLTVSLKESEKKTLWNIQECNKIAAQKANREYVDSACVLVEEKLKKEIRQTQQDGLSDINNKIKELQNIQQQIQKNQDEMKIKNQKSLESQKIEILAQVVSSDQFDTQNKENQEQTLKIQREIMKINAKGDPQEYFQKSMDIINILQDKIKKIDYDNIKINSELELILRQIEKIGEQADSVQGKQDEHQPGLCKLEASVELLTKQFEQFTEMIRKTDKELRDRFNVLDLGVFQKLDLFKKNQEEQRPVIISQILEYVNKFFTQLEDKIKLFKSQVNGLDGKLKKNQQVQNDILQSFFYQQQEIGEIDLQKIYNMIDLKMDKQYCLNEFKLHQAILDGLDNFIKQQNNELEAMDKLYKQLKFLIENGGVEVIKNIVSHRITKIRCTMCNTEQEERFAKKKEWPYDPNVKLYHDNQKGKICEGHEKQEIYDLCLIQFILAKKEISNIKKFNQGLNKDDKIILPGDTVVKYNKNYQN